MVIIVIALTERKQRHEKRVAGAASRRIRLTPHSMAGRINQECAMLKHDNSRDATNEKTSQRAEPPIPEKTSQRWQTKSHQHREQMNMSMLPHHERILFQIGHVIERWLWQELEQQPANVGVEKTFTDVVRVFVVIHMFMMAAVFACPHQHRILERSGATDEREQAHR